MLTPERVRLVPPELVSVTAWVAAVAPTGVEENVRLVAERLDAGAEVAAFGHPFTTLATLSEPRPVALSYPAVAAYPGRIPSASPEVCGVQLVVPP
jgi:hypothetical protein